MFNQVKNAIAQTFGNETLEKTKVKKEKEKQKVAKKPTEKAVKSHTRSEPEIIEDVEYTAPQKDINTHPVLGMLNIPAYPNLSGLITSKDVDEVEFNLSAPTGLNPDEIEIFCNNVSTAIYRYNAIIEERQKHFEILLNEVDRLSQKLIEKQAESELSQFISYEKTEDSRIKDEIIELRLQNEELQSRLKELAIARDKQMQTSQPLPNISKQETKDIEEDMFKQLLSGLEGSN